MKKVFNTEEYQIQSLGSIIPSQLEEETLHAKTKLYSSLGNDIIGYVANRLQLLPDELSVALATEQVEGVALAIYNIEARSQSVIIGDQTGIGKGRQAAALIRYGMLSGYFPIFLTDRYTLFSDMYRDCKALGIKGARPLILNQRVSVVDFDKPIDKNDTPTEDEIWTPTNDLDEDSNDEDIVGIYARQYEEVYKSPQKAELDLMYRNGDIPKDRFEYMMLTYSQLKDAKKDMTRLDFLSSLCEKHRVLFVFDEAHKSSSVSSGKISVITQCINSIIEVSPKTQCVFLSATFAKRPECLITFMGRTILSSLATNETLQAAFSNGGVPMQEYVASKLAKEGQMIRREHSGDNIPEPVYTYLDDKLTIHSELFDTVMFWFRELVKLSDIVKEFMNMASLMGVTIFRPYPTRAQLFYVNKILLLSLKARDVAEAAVREVQSGKSVVIGMSDTLECVLRDYITSADGECERADFSSILLRLLEKTLNNPKNRNITIFDLDLTDVPDASDLQLKLDEIKSYADQIRSGIKDEIFHLPISPIDVIRQLITQESFTNKNGITLNIRFEECTGRARQLEYLSPEGDDEFVNATIISRKKRHSSHIYNDFQNNKLDVILINACGAIGASAHAIATAEVPENEVRQRKMLIVQNDLDVNIDLQKRGRINRTGQIEHLPPLYEYIITAIPSEKRLNMMLRAKLRSLSANTTANQDQDKKQADFIDITNKYGNQVTQEFLAANPELAFILGLSKTSTATQLLARIAMLSVGAQQEIIDEIFGSYQNLEQELRRINQWDLEREYRDFEAEFIREELFSAAIDKTVLGGASMLTTFRCRHRTFPYDSITLHQQIKASTAEYGQKLYQSAELQKEIEKYYRTERKKIRAHIQERKEKLYDSTLATLIKYDLKSEEAKQLMELAQYNNLISAQKDIDEIIKDNPKASRITRKIDSYQLDFKDLENREQKNLQAKSNQRKNLLNVISKTEIGKLYNNILSVLPVEENVDRVMAVLKEVRFGRNPAQKFLPGKVQFVFALSAIHKELVFNLVDKGQQNNYNRLLEILSMQRWEFNPSVWDSEIARYNNRILERKIITGNILGAFANPIIQKIKPRFITFSLYRDEKGIVNLERGLLLPMSGENVDKLMECVALPIEDGLKYANVINRIYQISGIGVDFYITAVHSKENRGLSFYISVNEKDSRKFESDERFECIRSIFKATRVTSIHNKKTTLSKRPLKRYSTDNISGESPEFTKILTLLASFRAVILIPREYFSVGEMKEFAKERNIDENSNWPDLEWRTATIIPPERKSIITRISSPVVNDANVIYVDEFSPLTLLCKRTIEYHGKSFRENTIPGQIRALYYEWLDYTKDSNIDNHWKGVAYKISSELHRILVNSAKQPLISFNDIFYKTLEDEVNKYQLSAVGKTIIKFREEMVFLAPPKELAMKFLDSCLYDVRLASIRKNIEDYITGKTEIILDV